MLAVLFDLDDRVERLDQIVDRQPPCTDPLKQGRLSRRAFSAFDCTQGVCEKAERSPFGDGWVELTERARRRVAWIGEEGLAFCRPLVVELFKSLQPADRSHPEFPPRPVENRVGVI